MMRLVIFVAAASLLIGGAYVFVSYLLFAPKLSMRIVVVGGTLIFLGGVAFCAAYWPHKSRAGPDD
jgi:hypothetical protein